MQQVIQGDCLEVMKTFESESIDLIATDPPYGMAYQSSWRTEKFEKIENDTNLDWLTPFLQEAFRVLKENTHIYLFCNDYAISDFRRELEKAGFTPKRTLVWVKNNHTSGDLEGDYANKTEFVVFGHKGRRLLNGNRDTNVLMCDRVSQMNHPTEKPVELMEKLILKSTAENEIVLDPFCGSGSTLVAAKNLKRKWIGIDIAPQYAELAEARLKATPNSLF